VSVDVCFVGLMTEKNEKKVEKRKKKET
jgi:hypothetical protein